MATQVKDVEELDLENTHKTGMDDSEMKDLLKENGLVEMMTPLVADIRDKFDEAERARQTREYQWLRNVNSYRGHDTASARFRDSEKSKVFVRTTTVKVKAAYAQIIEALFADGTFPIDVTHTIIPEGTSEFAHLKIDMDVEPQGAAPEEQGAPEGPLAGIGFAGDGFDIAPGSTSDKMMFLGGMKEEWSDEQGETPLAEGPSRDPSSPTFSPAKESARRMRKAILDHLEETKARTEVRKAVFEMCLMGTGVIKGPFNTNKTLHRWELNEETGEKEYMPEQVQTPRSSMVSTWNFYPDPNATRHEEMEWAIERHKMNHSQVRSLKKRPHFDGGAIDRLLTRMGNYERKSYEHTLDEKLTTESEGRLFEVLEFWGYVDREYLEEYNLPTDQMVDDFVQVNVWVSGNEVLRVVVNPFIPQRIPYYVVPYEVDPYSIWGTGVPESMEDTQALMNGFARLAVDNLALAGSLVFDVDESMLVPGQDMTIEPGKIFRRQMGGAGQAIYGLKFPNTANENLMMFDRMRQLADETTGIPSFAHGQMGVMSPTRTASGMSMLLQNASLNIKTVIRNIDDYLLKPFGESYYRWEMQFNPDIMVQGDLEVKATGSSSLQAKEVRSQRLNSFLQMAANPALAPLIKLPTVLREFAITMDIDPDEILNNPDEARLYAELMGIQNMQSQGAQQSAEQQMGASMAGGVQAPGTPGFTGNTEGAGNELGIGGSASAESATASPV
jgi:hypothetical protein